MKAWSLKLCVNYTMRWSWCAVAYWKQNTIWTKRQKFSEASAEQRWSFLHFDQVWNILKIGSRALSDMWEEIVCFTESETCFSDHSAHKSDPVKRLKKSRTESSKRNVIDTRNDPQELIWESFLNDNNNKAVKIELIYLLIALSQWVMFHQHIIVYSDAEFSGFDMQPCHCQEGFWDQIETERWKCYNKPSISILRLFWNLLISKGLYMSYLTMFQSHLLRLLYLLPILLSINLQLYLHRLAMSLLWFREQKWMKFRSTNTIVECECKRNKWL